MKVCNICNVEKPYTEYFKAKNNRDGYMASCKTCQNNRVNNNMKMKDYIGKDRDELIERTRRLLTILGYTLDDPNNPISSQFNRRFLMWKYNRGL